MLIAQGRAAFAQVFDQRGAAVAAQDGARGAEGFHRVLLRECGGEEDPQVLAGVVEVAGEDDVRPGEGAVFAQPPALPRRLLTMLAESGSGTLAGSAHQQAFDQVGKADAVLVRP